jgi:hypothetical protein
MNDIQCPDALLNVQYICMTTAAGSAIACPYEVGTDPDILKINIYIGIRVNMDIHVRIDFVGTRVPTKAG